MLKIAVALDFSDSTQQILDYAKKLADSAGSELWLLHVEAPEPDFVGYEVGPESVRDSVASEIHQDHTELQKLKVRVVPVGRLGCWLRLNILAALSL